MVFKSIQIWFKQRNLLAGIPSPWTKNFRTPRSKQKVKQKLPLKN